MSTRLIAARHEAAAVRAAPGYEPPIPARSSSTRISAAAPSKPWALASQIGHAVSLAVWGTHGPTVVQLEEPGQPVHIAAPQIKAERRQALSIMPEGLLDNLEPQQAADLLAWLAERK